MRFSGWLSIMAVLMAATSWAPGQYNGNGREPLFRWTGGADWEFYQTDATLDGVESSFNSIRQKYTVDVSGSIWDPRFNRLSLGLDLIRTDRSTDLGDIDSKSLGYRAQTMFFPNRPFPLSIYARNTVTDISGFDLPRGDRETQAWGVRWTLGLRPTQKIRLSFDRTNFDVLSPLLLKERSSTGIVGFDQTFERSNISFQYNRKEERERVNDSEFIRNHLTVAETTRFLNGSHLRVNARHTISKARFISGMEDDLRLNQLSTAYELPERPRTNMTITYNLNESQGMFLDSISHALGTQGRLKLSKHVESTGALDLGRITTRGVSNDIDLTRGGVRTGLRYGREWSRLQFGFSGSAGYSEEHFDALPRRQLTYLGGSLDGRYGLTSKDDIFWEVWTRVNDNDAIGVGFTYSEDRASLGWERRFERHWRLKNSVYTRRSTYDTFQFGVQESDEVGLTGTLENSVGGLNYSISSTEGISDFIPDPGTSGRFLPGTDLVNKTDMATLGTHWRIGSWVTIQGQVRREHRSFTTIGVEDITSYQAEARFQRNTWTVSTRYSSYERADGLMFVDDTWMLRISKLFY